MKTKILIALLTVCCFAACTKDKFTTKPRLTLDEINGDIFPKGSQLAFTLTGTDKEGDIKDTLWVERVSLICPELRSITTPYALPDFPHDNSLDAKFDIIYNYGSGAPPSIDGCVGKDDSSYFRFWIKDNANNVSDTVESPVLVLLN